MNTSMTYPIAMPDAPLDIASSHASTVIVLTQWLNNGVHDVCVGVDAQMVAWSDAWPSDGCGTTEAAKDWASAVMRAKCAILGIPFPVLTPGEGRAVDWTRTWDQSRILGSDDTFPAGTPLYMSGNPRTDNGGSVYFGNGHPLPVVTVNEVSAGDMDISVRRADGERTTNAMISQVVARRHLRVPGPISYVDPVISLEPAEPVPGTNPEQAEIDRLRQALADARRHHVEDIGTISRRFIGEAERRRWCSEYDEIVDDLNSDLHVEMDVREREHEILVSGYIRVPFSYSVTVTAPDEDSAQETVSENLDSYLPDASSLLTNYTDRYAAEVDDDSIEVETN